MALEIGILGKTFGASVIAESPWDAENARLRGELSNRRGRNA